jgi:hypothetical protein
LRAGKWCRVYVFGSPAQRATLDDTRYAVEGLFEDERRQAVQSAEDDARQERARKILATHGGLAGVRVWLEDRQARLVEATAEVERLRRECDVFKEAVELATKLDGGEP